MKQCVLVLNFYIHRYGDLIENDSYYSDVFSTLKKAVAEGKWWLDRKIQDLYQESGYCTQREDSLTIEDMIKDKAIYWFILIISIISSNNISKTTIFTSIL